MTWHSGFIRVFFIITLLVTGFYRLPAQTTQYQSDSLSVVQAVNHFVGVFTQLDWPAFSACFAEDATAFFPPSARHPERVDGKKDILKIFSGVFENARKQKATPPYLSIEPKELKMQLLGVVAIVTFMLDDPGMFGRRSIVLRKDNGRWLIVHLHASGVAL
ncbi:MAG: nuclear transport factor 2 family protein [Bacteroidetes bacterium]|nr:nuclear transport factor 2 family protein [Bacteroidota bacterium]